MPPPPLCLCPPKSHRLLDLVPAFAHEFSFPIDLWVKSWTSDGGVGASGPLASSGELCHAGTHTVVTPIDQSRGAHYFLAPLVETSILLPSQVLRPSGLGNLTKGRGQQKKKRFLSGIARIT